MMIEAFLLFGCMLLVMFWLWLIANKQRRQLDEAEEVLSAVRGWLVIESGRSDPKPIFLESVAAQCYLRKIDDFFDGVER